MAARSALIAEEVFQRHGVARRNVTFSLLRKRVEFAGEHGLFKPSIYFCGASFIKPVEEFCVLRRRQVFYGLLDFYGGTHIDHLACG